MNKKELMVMAYMRKNSRATLTEISRKTGVPVSTIYEKLKRTTPALITKNTCIVDFSRLGFYARAKVVLQASMSHKQELSEFLVKHQNINSVYKINNGFDFLAECIFRNVKELEEFLEQLQSRFKIRKYEIYFIIEDIKREAFLSDPQTVELVV